MAEVAAAIRGYQRAVDAFDDAAAARLGVNRTDLRCLDVLLERGAATPGALAAALGITTGSVTAMLDRLEALGYLRRTADPADRRRVAVRPTRAAVEAARQLWGPLAAEGGGLMACYRTAELEVVLDLLQRTRELQEMHTRRIRKKARREKQPRRNAPGG